MKLLSLLSSPSSDVARALAGFERTIKSLDAAESKAGDRIDLIDEVSHRLANERMKLSAAKQKAASVRLRILAIVG